MFTVGVYFWIPLSGYITYQMLYQIRYSNDTTLTSLDLMMHKHVSSIYHFILFIASEFFLCIGACIILFYESLAIYFSFVLCHIVKKVL